MKPYQTIPIQDCGEPLIPLPRGGCSYVTPHPYVKLGAPYGDKSPYYLRQAVYERLIAAQQLLRQRRSHWSVQIFDAYRPIAVQQFMVNHAYHQLLSERGMDERFLSNEEKQELLTEVYQFWALPSDDAKTPPPHSTGAALDVSLVDENDTEIDMGSPIDELSLRSYPDYFMPNSQHRLPADQTPTEVCDRFHKNRELLRNVMTEAGFQQHPNEWWHFSYGDQLWAWLTRERTDDIEAIARYGGVL